MSSPSCRLVIGHISILPSCGRTQHEAVLFWWTSSFLRRGPARGLRRGRIVVQSSLRILVIPLELAVVGRAQAPRRL